MKIQGGILLLALCAFAATANAIVNGKDVGLKIHPEAAKILITARNAQNNKMTFACTGVFISNSVLLTAGHCAPDVLSGERINPKNIILYSFGDKPLKHPVHAIAFDSQFSLTGEEIGRQLAARDQKFKKYLLQAPNCYSVPLPLLSPNSPDLALISFPPHTSDHFTKVDFNYVPHLGDKVSFVGFGTSVDPFAYGSFGGSLNTQKRLGTSTVMRVSDEYAGIKAPANKAYAAPGDSGSPVYYNGQLVGIMSYMDTDCESKWGSDFGILNTFTYFSSKNAAQFLMNSKLIQ